MVRDFVMNTLLKHYGLLLGLDESWRVAEVDLQLAAQRVEIRLESLAGQPVCCALCDERRPHEGSCSGAVVAAFGHDALDGSRTSNRLSGVRREDGGRAVSGAAWTIYGDALPPEMGKIDIAAHPAPININIRPCLMR